MPQGREKRALITGITGQDGSYLAEFLLRQGYRVSGLVRQTGSDAPDRLRLTIGDEAHARLQLIPGDITDGSSVRRAMDEAEPDEIYHLAGQSNVELSFSIPEYTLHCIAGGTLILLEAVRRYAETTGRAPRLFNASTSEIFGESPAPMSESSAQVPRSPYAIAKAAAHRFAIEYRQTHGLFVCNGIMFNHESPRRGLHFVTRKITLGLAAIKAGSGARLHLGNLNARRDWGFAGDYVEAMHRMLQHAAPEDFVIATGTAHGIEDVLRVAAEELDMDWRGAIEQDPALLRPSDARVRIGDPSRIRDTLGWRSRKPFDVMIREMARADYEVALSGGDRGAVQ